MRLGRVLKNSMLLATAVLIGFIAAEFRAIRGKINTRSEIEEWQGLVREGVDQVLRSPLTFSDVVESNFDSDNNGSIDLRIVSIHEDTPYYCEYMVTKMTKDGIPQRLIVNVGSELTFLSFDFNEDGSRPVKFRVSIGNTSNLSENYIYEDLDLNGSLDKMSTFVDDKKQQAFILYEDAWQPLVQGESGLGGHELILDSDGQPILVSFQNGSWQHHSHEK